MLDKDEQKKKKEEEEEDDDDDDHHDLDLWIFGFEATLCQVCWLSLRLLSSAGPRRQGLWLEGWGQHMSVVGSWKLPDAGAGWCSSKSQIH